jgi:hypothetical protein
MGHRSKMEIEMITKVFLVPVRLDALSHLCATLSAS